MCLIKLSKTFYFKYRTYSHNNAFIRNRKIAIVFEFAQLDSHFMFIFALFRINTIVHWQGTIKP